ncbi:MAG: transposase [Terriglobia bacterium]
MRRLTRYYGFNHAHFITTCTYRRACLFDSESFKRIFVRALGDARDALDFKLIGYVLMPEHFHLLLWPSAAANPSAILRSLKVRTALKVLETLREHQAHSWCGRMLERLRLPATVQLPPPTTSGNGASMI